MRQDAEFDIIVYGATGFTGRLVAEHLAKRYGVGGEVKWAMAGRSADKLAAVRDEIGAPADTPFVVADADDKASLKAMVERTKAVITTVGPYQLYGADLVAACVEAGTDYLDLCGEPVWMRHMINAHEAKAKETGARIVFSCGFDSIPFDLGVVFLQHAARERLGAPLAEVHATVRAMKGGFSGGTAASLKATMAALSKDPSLFALMVDPFALTPGFKGPEQPRGDKVEEDSDLGATVGPFVMAAINTRNVHRSNLLTGHAYGQGLVYDEMVMVDPNAPPAPSLGAEGGPKPGEGPSKEERETGFFDVLFIGLGEGGEQMRVAVTGDKDPGYGCTSKMIGEAAICLINEAFDVPGGVWTPGAAMGMKLIERLRANAGMTFEVEA
ncbi:MAG: saccharopine dehydrogenase family protein [Alphaproteobacteria bacterium]